MNEAIVRTAKYIRFLSSYVESDDIIDGISVILLKLGFVAQGKSFLAVRTAVYLYLKNPDQLLMDSLYIDVARTLGRRCNKYQVEATVRRAVKYAWDYGDSDGWELFFPGIRFRKRPPTNRDFLDGMVRILNVWIAFRGERK